MKMAFCLRAIKTLGDSDLASLTEKVEAYTQAGMGATAAEMAAVDDMLTEVLRDRVELQDAVRTQHPDLFAGPDAKPAPPTAPAKAVAEKIYDFGEKLDGARKDFAAKMRDAMAVDVRTATLAEAWPEPNYAKLIDGGADPFAVGWVRASRDEIPTKPQMPWKLGRWVDSVTLLRKVSQDLLSGAISKQTLKDKLAGELATLRDKVGGRAELYEALGHEQSLKGIEVSSGSYSMRGGVVYSPAKTLWTVERKAKGGTFGNWPRELAMAETRQGAINQFIDKVKGGAKLADSAKGTEFVIWRDSGKYHVGKKIGTDYASLKKFDSVAEARKYKAENPAELEAALARYKDTPFERRTENLPRVGEDHRGAARVTPEVFDSTFGFRGIQFGNYVEQTKRQADLNDAYDALMDLAAVIGVPPRALSLGGQLGLAFGARGKGGKNAAAAHYEPGTVVINLTKESGAGSLAHELLHVMDNYFAKLDGGKGGMMTTGASNPAVRPEMVAAFKRVTAAVNQPGMKARAKELDKRRSKAYWSTSDEMAARSFEAYVIAKLRDQGAANDYLANIVSPEMWDASEALLGHGDEKTYPYPTQEEMGPIREAFDGFFDTIQTRTDEAGNVAMYSKSPQNEAPDAWVYRYWSSRAWASEDAAREMIRGRIVEDNERYAGAFKPQDPALADGLVFVKAPKGEFKLKQPKAAPLPFARIGDPVDSEGGDRPRVDWESRDMADDGTSDSVLQAYGRGHGNVYRAWVDPSLIPPPKGAGIEGGYPNMDGEYDWQELQGRGSPPPLKLRVGKNGKLVLMDGNHRLAWWREKGVSEVPAYVIDERPQAMNVQFSRAAPTGPAITEPQARAAVATTFGDKTARALLDAGLIEFVTGRDFNGATYADGRIQINLDAVTQDTISGVLQHEAFHAAVRDWLGAGNYAALMNRMGNLRKLAARPGALKTWFDKANAAIPEDTRPEHLNDELAAYAIQEEASRPQPGMIGKWVQDFLSALRTAIIRRMPDGKIKAWALLNVKPQDLARMAVQAMQARGAAVRGEAQGAMAYSKSAQTETPAFKRWFGDSKVVDADGKPLVVYHGTNASFSVFTKNKALGGGMFFSPSPKEASAFAFANGANIMPVYLQADRVWPSIVRSYNEATAIAKAKSSGYDAVRVRDAENGLVNWVVFRPEQIKSATGNAGTFDPGSADIRYSRTTSASTAKRQATQAVRDTVADFLGDAGAKVSWWDKTLGTQYAKAQKLPAFKRVFDAVQQYLVDTSAMANEAADQAKSILPKLETWKDLLKFGLNAADAKAIAAPIFTGTLNESKVYTDAELRDRFKLTDAQVGQYREFLAAVNTSLDQAMAAEALRMLGDKNAALRELALTDRAALRTGVDEFLAQQAKQAGEDASATGDKRGEFTALRGDIADAYKRIDSLKAAGYAPLMRFGKYKLTITSKAGDTLFFGLYESKSAANEADRDMRADPAFAGADFDRGVLSAEQYKLFSAMPLDSLEMFAGAIGAEKSEVYQDFIRLAKNNRSAMKRLLKRKGTAGFSEDVPRVLAAFVTSNSRMAAGALNMPTAKEAAQDIRDGDVQDEAIKLLETVQNPTDTAGAVRGLMFVNFIGGSIASAVVNLTQPLTMTLPHLSQWGGGVKAAGRLMTAGKMVASGKVNDPALRLALKRAEIDGIVSPQEIHHLKAQAMGTFGSHPMLQRAAFIWAAPFSLAEQFNRRVSFVAAYQTATEQGIEDPFGFAKKAVIETQDLYNKGNAPNLARGAVGAAALTFKQFSIHYLEWMVRMYRSGPDGKKAVLLALAMLVLAAGADGLPFADDLDDLVDTLGQALGYDLNVKRARRDFVANQLGLGDEVADIMARGFSAVPGVPMDVSIRMSMGNPIPGTAMFKRSNTDKSRDLLEIAGPAGGLAKQYIEAGTKALKGDFGGAVESALPVALQNVMKGAGMWSTGQARDTLGRKIMDADEVDGLMKFLGFQPQAIARESQKISMIRNSEQLAKNVEGEIASSWARALVDGDVAAVDKARAKLAQWNEDNPESPIRIKMQQIIARTRKLREERASRFITSVSPERRRAVAEALE